VETGGGGGGAAGVVGVVGVFEPPDVVVPVEVFEPVDVFEPVEPVEVVEVVGAVGVVGGLTELNTVEALASVSDTVGSGTVVAAVGAVEAGAAGLGEEVPCGDPPVGWASPSLVMRRIETPTVGRVRRPTARTVMEPPVTGIRTEILALRRYRLVVAYRSSGPISSLIRLRLALWLEIAILTE
jgi:hypothetical protein